MIVQTLFLFFDLVPPWPWDYNPLPQDEWGVLLSHQVKQNVVLIWNIININLFRMNNEETLLRVVLFCKRHDFFWKLRQLKNIKYNINLMFTWSEIMPKLFINNLFFSLYRRIIEGTLLCKLLSIYVWYEYEIHVMISKVLWKRFVGFSICNRFAQTCECGSNQRLIVSVHAL